MLRFALRHECPACGGMSFSTLYSCAYLEDPVRQYLRDFYDPQGGVDLEYLRGGNYTLCQCEDCSLVFQREILDADGMQLLYEKWIDPDKVVELYESDYPLEYYREYAAVAYQVTDFFKRPPRALRFFDFGMGWGNWLLSAKGFGVQVYGAELSQRRIDHARRNGIGIVSWDEIPGQDFDYINTDQVFEHLAEPLETLKHVVRGLRQGGLMRISVPDGRHFPSILARMDWQVEKGQPDSVNVVAPLEHVNCFTTRSLTRMASLAGLEWVFMSAKQREMYFMPMTDWEKMHGRVTCASSSEPEGTDLFFIKP
jgi:2-polyprenyl-3-methyl-5-hydroxy-6-metoxy-1,4-benzoquinol methylase